MRVTMRALSAVAALALVGCGGTWQAEPLGSIEAGQAPECVVFDGERGVAYVSNVVADHDGGDGSQYWADDANGRIARLPVGGLVEHGWIRHTPAAPLHAPKGMAVLGDHLAVADNTRLLIYNLKHPDAAPRVVNIAGAQRLNDVAAKPWCIYVSDTAAGRIYRVNPDNGAYAAIPAPPGVNGITARGGELWCVSWTEHEIYRLDPEGRRQPQPLGLADHFRTLDGIELLDDGAILVSDMAADAVWLVGRDRTTVTKLVAATTPADIGLDRDRMVLYVPRLKADRVELYRLRRR